MPSRSEKAELGWFVSALWWLKDGNFSVECSDKSSVVWRGHCMRGRYEASQDGLLLMIPWPVRCWEGLARVRIARWHRMSEKSAHQLASRWLVPGGKFGRSFAPSIKPWACIGRAGCGLQAAGCMYGQIRDVDWAFLTSEALLGVRKPFGELGCAESLDQ